MSANVHILGKKKMFMKKFSLNSEFVFVTREMYKIVICDSYFLKDNYFSIPYFFIQFHAKGKKLYMYV